MNFRNTDSKDSKEGKSYLNYLDRKYDVFLKTLCIMLPEEEAKTSLEYLKVSMLYAPYMEKLKLALEEKTGLQISYEEVDLVFGHILTIVRNKYKTTLRQFEVDKHMLELHYVNQFLDLADDTDHLDAITSVMFGQNPLKD